MSSGEGNSAGDVAPQADVSIGKLLTGDILVGTMINIVMNLFFCWLTFPRDQLIQLTGMPGLLFDTLPATIIPAFMMTLAVTTILRKRVRGGLRVETKGLPFALPRSLVARALVIVAISLLLVAAPTVIFLLATWSGPWSWSTLILFKVLFSAFHSIVLTPVVVLGELQRRSIS